MRIRSSSSDRKKREAPGSPWRPARPRSWLSMRRRLVALGADDVEPAGRQHLLVLLRADLEVRGRAPRRRPPARFRGSASLRAIASGLPPSTMSVPRPAMLVAMVTAPLRPAWATIDGLALVVLGVEHDVRTPLGAQLASRASRCSRSRWCRPGPAGRARGRRGSPRRRRPTSPARSGRSTSSRSSRIIGSLVGMTTHVEVVDLAELGRLGLGGAGHARQLVVHAEVVLEGDRGEGLVLALDRARPPWPRPPGAGRRTSAGRASGGR